MARTVLILGPSGKIGRHAALSFAAAGWEVRHFRRGTDMAAAAMGADVIVNGLNPPKYHDWARLVPAITAEVIAAARASGATVILPGNVYNFGGPGGVWDETTPQRATSRKGRLRIGMEAAYRASGVQTIVLRAGNFIVPEVSDDLLRLVTLKGIASGKVTSLGDPAADQAWVYVPDWARAAVMLAERRESLAPFEDVPMPGYTLSADKLAAEVAALTGRRITVGRFPWWALRIAAPFWELAREMVEMRALYDTPHRLGSAKFDRLLPEFRATEVAVALAQVLKGDVDPDEVMRTGGQTVLPQQV